MAKVERFEDLKCWQKARELVNLIYKVTGTEPLCKDFELRNQLRSAAISSMSNIAEGFSRYHKKEFIRFLDISQSSAAEVKSLMYVVLDQRFLPGEKVKEIQNTADECRNLTLGLLRYLDRSIKQPPLAVEEPDSPYGYLPGNPQPFWNAPEEFISRQPEHMNT
jgi:four helix bundle protein